jgi:hypothetical protein
MDIEMNEDFLNPKSMSTPGFAGAITMLITNTISFQFGLSDRWPAFIGLIISFLFGTLVMAKGSLSGWERAVYYVLNSVIIFAVAVGTNTIPSGHQGMNDFSRDNRMAFYGDQLFALLSPIGISTAHAQLPQSTGWCCSNQGVISSSSAECQRQRGRFFSSQPEARQACQQKEQSESTRRDSDPNKKVDRFFKPWF